MRDMKWAVVVSLGGKVSWSVGGFFSDVFLVSSRLTQKNSWFKLLFSSLTIKSFLSCDLESSKLCNWVCCVE